MRALALLCVACTSAPCPPADLTPIDGEASYAFVASDYASTAIGLLDRDGEIVREAWIDSGSAPPRIVAALSGDVVLSSAPIAPCVLTVIDRFGVDVITFLDTCGEDPVIGQLDVGANPQDVIALDDARALVSRHDPSFDPEIVDGNDLIEIDWRAQRILSRIDLNALDTIVDGERIYARPQRMTRIGDAIVVGLARLSADFMIAGPGAVAIVDPISFEVRALDLPDLANCAEVDAMGPDRALVTCNGVAFGHEDDRRAGAGLVLLEMIDGTIDVRSTWRAVDHPDQPVFNTGSVPISEDCAVTTAMGDARDALTDRVGVLCFDGDVPLLANADDAFVIGDGAFDPTARVLFLPDASVGIRRFAMDDQSELDPIGVGCRGLPAREIRALTSSGR